MLNHTNIYLYISYLSIAKKSYLIKLYKYSSYIISMYLINFIKNNLFIQNFFASLVSIFPPYLEFTLTKYSAIKKAMYLTAQKDI